MTTKKYIIGHNNVVYATKHYIHSLYSVSSWRPDLKVNIDQFEHPVRLVKDLINSHSTQSNTQVKIIDLTPLQ